MEKKIDLKPTQFVLVRDNDQEEWVLSIYSHRSADGRDYCGDRCEWKYIIPYEGNEHLLGTTDAYVEPYEPKDGDFVTYTYPNGNKYVAIFKCTDSNLIDNYYVDICLKNNVEEFLKISYDNGFDMGYSERRLSTEEEKELLLSKLHEKGKDWDAEKKEIVEYRWTPKEGNLVYFYDWCSQTCRFICCSILYNSTDGQTLRDKMGNCYRTNKECLSMCDKLNEAIQNVK